jgi:hypothetical protein
MKRKVELPRLPTDVAVPAAGGFTLRGHRLSSLYRTIQHHVA